MRFRVLFAFAAMLCLGIGGCGRKPTTYPVSGTIVYNKKPVPQVMLFFWPENDKRDRLSALSNDDGEFTLKCPKGKYKVTVLSPDTPELSDSSTGGAYGRVLAMHRDVQNSPLTLEVTEKGVDNVVLELKAFWKP